MQGIWEPVTAHQELWYCFWEQQPGFHSSLIWYLLTQFCLPNSNFADRFTLTKFKLLVINICFKNGSSPKTVP